MQNSPTVTRVKVAVWTVAILLGIVVWNLWIHQDPLHVVPDLIMGIAGGTADHEVSPWPSVPWLMLLPVAASGVWVISCSLVMERLAAHRAAQAELRAR